MATGIGKYEGSKGILGSAALKLGLGALTGGGSLGATGAIAGGGLKGAALGAAGAASPVIGAATGIAESAIGRRVLGLKADPTVAVEEGLSALKDPSVPDAVRQDLAPKLLQAKYYGPKGYFGG